MTSSYMYGRGNVQHGENLEIILQRQRTNNITLNKPKCEFDKNNVEFPGNIFSTERKLAEKRKLAAIRNASPWKNVLELLGITSYYSPYSKLFH